MSSANVELVRSIFVAWERGDFSSAEWADPEIKWVTAAGHAPGPATALKWAHRDIEFVIADGPSPASWTGLDRMAEGWRDFLIGWADFRGKPEEFRVLDGERVFVLTHFSARGKKSGLEVGQIWTRGAH